MSSGVDDDDTSFEFGDTFKEPEGFLPPPPEATFTEHRICSGEVLKLRLVGSHPLYGHLLWNAGRTITDYLEDRADEWITGKDILELGAGAGLPSMVCAIRGAKTVVVTDYPDYALVENLRLNAAIVEPLAPKPSPLVVEGYKWGEPVDGLLKYVHISDQDKDTASKAKGFDVLILADVIYNHPQHRNLLASVQMALKRSADAVAFVVFTPYQPWLLEKIVAFFPLAEENGFVVTKLFEKTIDKLLFEDDPGDEKLRRTVFGYELRWKPEEISKSSQ